MSRIKTPTHPVAIVVEPLRQSAMDNAEKYVRADVVEAYAALETAKWDLDVAAPRVRGGFDPQETEKRRFYGTITKSVRGYEIKGQPNTVEKNPAGVEYLVKQARRDAEASFIGYVNKLVGKIGDDVKHVELRGIDKSNLWARSELTISRADGSVEKWLTQQIWNRSILGKSFPQWPTRQTEGAKRELPKKVVLVHAQRDGRYFKLCSHPISRTGHSGVIVADESKVTCPRCLNYLAAAKARKAQAARSTGAAS